MCIAVVGPMTATLQNRPSIWASPLNGENARCSRKIGRANSADDGAKNTVHHCVGSVRVNHGQRHLLWDNAENRIHREAGGAERVP